MLAVLVIIIEIIVDESIMNDLEISSLLLLSKIELEILIELNSQKRFILAKDIAQGVDIHSQRVWRICKKLYEEKGLVERRKIDTLYEYKITPKGEKYCE